MSMRRFSLLWIAVCLPALMAVQTNALLAVHLSACCDHDEETQRSDTPAHDQKHCMICQIALAGDGKAVAAETPVGIMVEQPPTQTPAVIESFLSLHTVSCKVSRGPPAV